MQSSTIILGITGALALAAFSVGCGGDTSSGAGGGSTTTTTGSATTSTSTGAGGGSTAATSTGSGSTTTAGSTGTGAASCAFTSSECQTCLDQLCSNTLCKGDMTCETSFETMRTGCACTAQKMMDGAAQDACVNSFAMTAAAVDLTSCIDSNCNAKCYLP